MDKQYVQELAQSLGAQAGVDAVALVDCGSGLVWHASAPQAFAPSIWEAAIEYWRLHQRLRTHFEPLGDLRAVALHHQARMMCMLPCSADEDLLVVCIARHRTVDWAAWQRRLRELRPRPAGT